MELQNTDSGTRCLTNGRVSIYKMGIIWIVRERNVKDI